MKSYSDFYGSGHDRKKGYKVDYLRQRISAPSKGCNGKSLNEKKVKNLIFFNLSK